VQAGFAIAALGYRRMPINIAVGLQNDGSGILALKSGHYQAKDSKGKG
jgi:hypothetical protein